MRSVVVFSSVSQPHTPTHSLTVREELIPEIQNPVYEHCVDIYEQDHRVDKGESEVNGNLLEHGPEQVILRGFHLTRAAVPLVPGYLAQMSGTAIENVGGQSFW